MSTIRFFKHGQFSFYFLIQYRIVNKMLLASKKRRVTVARSRALDSILTLAARIILAVYFKGSGSFHSDVFWIIKMLSQLHGKYLLFCRIGRNIEHYIEMHWRTEFFKNCNDLHTPWGRAPLVQYH